MVEHLPLNAPAHRALNGHAWTDETMIQRDISSQLRILNAALQNMFRPKGQPAVEPEFLPAPGVDDDFADGDVLTEAEAIAEQAEIRSNMERLWGP